MAVDIGAEAIDRGGTEPSGLTRVNKEGQATAAGTITSIDIYAVPTQHITGLRVGTFYVVSGNTLKCRASEAIAGTITGGSKTTKTVSIIVEIGDYIGCYFTSGRLENETTGFGGKWEVSGEFIDPNDEVAYTLDVNHAFSLGGYIEVPVDPSPVTDGDLIGIGIIRRS